LALYETSSSLIELPFRYSDYTLKNSRYEPIRTPTENQPNDP
jgi:hypothetical protein